MPAETRTVHPELLRHKPTIVQGMYFSLETREDVLRWLTEAGCVWWPDRSGQIRIATPHGPKPLLYGDTAIRGVADEFYPIRRAVREASYESAEDAPLPPWAED